jgi:hypothetical protein
VSRGDDRVARHDWNSFEGYFNAHDRRMADLCREGFILEDGLSRDWLGREFVVIRGRLRCQHSLFIDVLKYLEVRETRTRTMVRTLRYRYHAGVEGTADRPIFRYDNADIKTGHDDAHHKHNFDYTSWREIDPPQWVGAEGWPHLSEVVEELRDWWDAEGINLGLEPVAETTEENAVRRFAHRNEA